MLELAPRARHYGALGSPHLRSPAMPDDIHYYEPAQGHGLPHDPFNASRIKGAK